jgi:DNA-binding transcriptional LysR family regulator
MNEIDLRKVDLNLLVVFQILMAERHVGRAAARLFRTQSAVSHALGRLRRLFEDPLFIPHPKGVEPTARALALAPAITDILDRTRAALLAPSFDPSAPHTFTLATLDLTVPTVLLPLMERLRNVGPDIDMRVLSLDRLRVIEAFDRQEIDMAILNLPTPPARILRFPLFTDRFVGIARAGHPALRRRNMTAKVFAALPHLLVSVRGDPTGIRDEPFAPLDRLHRRVALTVPHMLAAPLIVANTDLVALVFERIARRFAKELGLTTFAPPITLPDFSVDLLVSTSRANEPGLRWLRDQVTAVCTT